MSPGPLHVTNGESVASTLRTTSLDDVVLSWDDVLHAGPLAFDPAECRPLRARFLAGHGWGEEAAIQAELERRDELLGRAGAVVLWFEHDLFDQLQLLQVLSQLGEATNVELVQADHYLGSLDASRLEALWHARRPVGDATRALAREAWRAVCEDDLEPLLERDLGALPHLKAALRRLREERSPLPRTKRQLLETLAEGPKRPPELFATNQAHEEAIFLGDAWCFRFVWELARDGLVRAVGGVTPPLPPPRGDQDSFAATVFELTPKGRELV
ncbi:MAG TPA: DUF1835 domain-containing protein [Gaiellaceae bacterium]